MQQEPDKYSWMDSVLGTGPAKPKQAQQPEPTDKFGWMDQILQSAAGPERAPADVTAVSPPPVELPPMPVTGPSLEFPPPTSAVEAGKGPTEARQFEGTLLNIAKHPVRSLESLITTPFMQGYSVGESMRDNEEAWDPNMGVMRAQRAFLRAEGKLTPELEAHMQKLEDYQENRRGAIALMLSGQLPGVTGIPAYAAMTRQRPGEAAAFTLAMLPVGILAGMAIKGMEADIHGGAADVVAQTKMVAPIQVNDEPPDPGFYQPEIGVKGPQPIPGSPVGTIRTEAPPPGSPTVGEMGGFKFAGKIKDAQAAYAAKKLSEFEPQDVMRSMWNAVLDLKPFEQMVVPGIDRETFMHGLSTWPAEIDYATHERPDGKLDVVAYGKESILTDDEMKKDFERHGYFEGQEAIWKGKPVKIDGLSAKHEMALVSTTNGEQYSVDTSELQRPPYTELSDPSPLEAETFYQKPPDRFSQATEALDAARELNLDPVKYIMSQINTNPERLNITEYEAKELIGDIDQIRELHEEHDDPHADILKNIIPDEWNSRMASHEELVKTLRTPSQTREVVRTQKSLESTWNDFDHIWSTQDEFARMETEFGKTGLGRLLGADKERPLPDVSDIQERYPDAWEEAMKYDDPREAMYMFSNKLSDMVESREISNEIAESLGGRMESYLRDRASHEVTKSFDARVRTYLRMNNLPPDQFQGYWRYFANKMGEKLRQQGLSPEEYSLFNEVAAKQVHTEMGLNDLASTNGYHLDVAPTGYFIRDSNTGELLAHASTPDEVRGFVNGSGASQGPSLDGAGKSNTVPPGSVAGPAQPPSGPPRGRFNEADDELHPPYEPHAGWAQNLADGMRLGLSQWMVRREAWFSAIDNKFGAKLWDVLFRPTQQARMMSDNAATPFLNEWAKIAKRTGKLSEDQWDKVTGALEQLSADEITSGKNYGRPLTEREINFGKLLGENFGDKAKNGSILDLNKVFRYLRAMDEAKERGWDTKEIDRAFALDDNHQRAAEMFNFIKGQDLNALSLGNVTRLAHAIATDAPTRQQFMGQQNFTPEMREAVDAAEDLYKRIGTAGGIDPMRIIGGYAPHYRLNSDAASVGQAFFFQKGWNSIPELKFLNDKVRTGEMDVYERNPIIAGMRYTHAVFRSQHFDGVMKDAMHDAQDQWNMLPKSIKTATFKMIDSYVNEISGRPDAWSQFTQGVFDKTLEQMHVDAAPSVRKDFVDTIAALIYTSGIGFRPAITLWHANQFLTLGGSRFGPRMLGEALYWASKGLTEHELVDDARNTGMVSPLNPSDFVSKDQMEATGLGGMIDKLESFGQKMATASMTMNGLKSVYELTQFGWGMAMRQRALNAMAKVSAGLWDEKQMASDINLDTFQPNIQQAFLERFRGGNPLEAARLIARQAATETAFQYGMANHPMGWSTNAGRLFGIYGVWPTWMHDYSLSMLSRGDWKTRAGWIGRFAAMQGATWLAARTAGIQPGRLLMGPGYFYDGLGTGLFHTFAPGILESRGGPIGGMLYTAAQAASQQNPNQREMYRRQLMRGFGMLVPGRGLWNDIYGAVNPSDPRQNLLQALSRIVGMKPSDWGAFR